MERLSKFALFFFALCTSVVACSDTGSGKATPGWTWMSGANTINQVGNYGAMGIAAPTNIPGARFGAVSWIDKNGNLWLFGGQHHDRSAGYRILNDLWKFDGTYWTWMSGSDTDNQSGTYGTKGTAAANNAPGSRSDAASWIDKNGNLWVFGGYGIDSGIDFSDLNDLWKFDGKNWTWVSGSNSVDQPGVYGEKGTPAADNVPGARDSAVTWIDKDGNLWLFGGYGIDNAGAYGDLNDLWKFDGKNWTWVSGSDTINQSGVYGTKGEPADSNIPGARNSAVAWIDKNNNLWLFGGNHYVARRGSVLAGDLNDLWKFDGKHWTWVSGSNAINQPGNYGIKGKPAPNDVPGPRDGAVAWTDKSDNFWLFGGNRFGVPSGTPMTGNLNDLWRFNGKNWTWVSGSKSPDQNGDYGDRASASPNNVPGARRDTVAWIDNNGNLWLFGGWGLDSTGMLGTLSDLWRYHP